MGTWGSLDFLDNAVYNFQKYKFAISSAKDDKSYQQICNTLLEEKRLALSRKYNLHYNTNQQ
jgi:lipopolysaccharide biosynthesis glycosyltransferase